jgi:hypothetical protein
MNQERKINRWDRRRANKRLKRLQQEEKYDRTVKSVDKIDIELPELSDKQRSSLEKDIEERKAKK